MIAMNVINAFACLRKPSGPTCSQKLVVENGAPTAADKRQINEGIEELLWLAR